MPNQLQAGTAPSRYKSTRFRRRTNYLSEVPNLIFKSGVQPPSLRVKRKIRIKTRKQNGSYWPWSEKTASCIISSNAKTKTKMQTHAAADHVLSADEEYQIVFSGLASFGKPPRQWTRFRPNGSDQHSFMQTTYQK